MCVFHDRNNNSPLLHKQTRRELDKFKSNISTKIQHYNASNRCKGQVKVFDPHKAEQSDTGLVRLIIRYIVVAFIYKSLQLYLQINEAFQYVIGRGSTGKVVISMDRQESNL